ncbi:MAG: TlpA family protein disulfide reductase [Myxococcales bacterium]|nr:TlpA family protein disulfide reductase [Myxococcales bacterium]
MLKQLGTHPPTPDHIPMFTVRARRLLLALSLLMLGFLALGQFGGAPALGVGSRIGPVRAELGDGGIFDLEQHRGEVVVLSFWASWCSPCRHEAKVLSALHAQGVRVVGLSVEELPLPALQHAAERIGIDYPVGQGSPKLLERLGVSVVPTTYVVGPDGDVRLAHSGVVGREMLQRAIAEPPG